MPESTEAAEVLVPTKTVTLAWPYNQVVGDEVVSHDPDTDVELPEYEANTLLLAGLAREVASGEQTGSEDEKPRPVNDILDEVGDDPEKAAAALAAEVASAKPRAALSKKLEIVIANAGKDN